MTTRSQVAALDSWICRYNSSNLGNGAGPRLQVGYSASGADTYTNRVLMEFSLATLLSGLTGQTLLTGVLKLKVRGTLGCFSQGGSPKLFAEKFTDALTENSENAECVISSGGATSARWGADATPSTTNRGSYSGSPSSGSIISIDLRALLQAELDAAGSTLRIRLISANSTLTGYQEDSESRKIAFYSSETTSPPELEITWNPNTAPNVPGSVLPADESVVVTTDESITWSGVFSDPDVGDTRSGTEIEVYADAATDGTPGTLLYSTGKVAGTSSSWSIKKLRSAMAGILLGTWYRSRIRDYDSDNAASAWTSLANGRFLLDAKPVVSGLSVAPDNLNPEFTASINAGKTISAYRLHVSRRNGDGSITTMRDTAKTSVGASPTTVSPDYNDGTGTNLALSWSIQYSYQITLWDQFGAASDETSEVFWTPVQNVGPSNMTPRLSTVKQPKRLFDYRIQHGSNFTGWAARFFSDPLGVSLLWTIPTQSVAATTDTGTRAYANIAGLTGSPSVPATPNWGDRLYWQAAVDTGGGLVWSTIFPIIVNDLPNAPVLSFPNAVLRADGVWVQPKTSAQITIRAPFVDPDTASFADVATRREDEIRAAASPVGSGALVGGATVVTTVSITDDKTVSAGIALESSYDVRTRYRDGNSESIDGPWSDWKTVKDSRAPTVTLTSPANASTVTDPTPLLDWAYASVPAKAQASFQVVVTKTADGSTALDSGVVLSVATAYTVPPFTLVTATGYTWHVTVTDTDGLSAVL